MRKRISVCINCWIVPVRVHICLALAVVLFNGVLTADDGVPSEVADSPCLHRGLAEDDVADDRVPIDVPDAVAASEQDMKPYAEPLEHTDYEIGMVPIHGGHFVMGSPGDEADRNENEGPRHEVEIAPFWMSKFEVTWDQYDTWGEKMDYYRRAAFGTAATPRDKVADAVTRPTPPYTDMSFEMGKENNPAICMTQHAARGFCIWLSAKTGRYYRLPTEAEWEYACRAGTSTPYSFGTDQSALDDFAWYKANSDGSYHPVGQKRPNPWGLYDMHGNVAEWVLDQYRDDSYQSSTGKVISNPLVIPTTLYPRVVRGGSWEDGPAVLRSAGRVASNEDWKEQDPQLPRSIWYHTDARGVGFRVVRPLIEPAAEERAQKWDKTDPIQLDPEEPGDE
jgi:formylglycine-generating enzyme required for sulfatase activity